MTNRASSFGATPSIPPLHRYGGRLTAMDELPVHGLGDSFTVDGNGAVTRLPDWPRGVPVFLNFTGTPTFVNSSKLLLPGGQNCAFSYGDSAWVIPMGDGVWRIVDVMRSGGGSFGGERVLNLADFGARGGSSNAANDTAALQNALAVATNASGNGKIVVPAGTFYINAINATLLSDFIIEGVGDRSVLVVNGVDAQTNWFDICGSNNICFRDIRIVDNGSTVPKNLFPWLKTVSGGTLYGLTFERVNISAKSSISFLYAYGYCGVGGGKSGGLSVRDCTWVQGNNGPSFPSTPYARNSLIHIDGLNILSVASANVTVDTTLSINWGTVLSNSNFVDNPSGFAGTSTYTNNTTLSLVTVTGFLSLGCSFQSHGEVSHVIHADCQGITFLQPTIIASDGGSGRTRWWVWASGGVNSYITYDGAFWSSPHDGFIAIDQGTGASAGGLWVLRLVSNNLGGNDFAVPFIVAPNGPGSFTASNPWLKLCHLELLDGGNNITTGGSIDQATIIQNPGVITVPSGAFDESFKPRGNAVTLQPFANLGGTSGTLDKDKSAVQVNAGGTFTLTLPSAVSYPGRLLFIKQVGAQTINSASSNVVPITSVTAGTAILSTAQHFCTLLSDGTHWLTFAIG